MMSVDTPGRLSARAFLYAIATGAGLGIAILATDVARGLSASEMLFEYSFANIALALTFAPVGGLILSRHPRHRVGALMLWIGIAAPVQVLLGKLGELLAPAGAGFAEWPLPVQILSWIPIWAWVPTVFPVFTLLPLHIPDGRLPSERWRPLRWASYGIIALLSVGFGGGIWPWTPEIGEAFATALTDPAGQPTTAAAVLMDVGFPLMLVVAAGVVASVVVRFRRSQGIERQQLKWFVYGVALAVPIVVGSIIAQTLYGENLLVFAGLTLGLIPIPLATGAAILRAGLYEIDVVISRTVTFAVLAAFITGIYVAIVVGLGTLVGRGDEPNLALSIAATALVAVAFEPVRSRVQRWANRLVFGRRASPYEVLSGLTARLAQVDSSEEALDRLAELVADGTGAEEAAVWLRVGDVLRRTATAGDEPADTKASVEVRAEGLPMLPGDLAVPVRHSDVLLGALTLTKATNDAVTPADDKLVKDAAAGATLLLRNLRLNAELAERARQLQTSRRRLVAEQDDARRKLERDLHDGAQQEVLGLKIKLSLAKTVADRTNDGALADTISNLAEEADRTVDAMRTIARGIYPPLLEAEGLETAIRGATARADVPVSVRATRLGRYDQATEATAYFCILEGVRNAVKHAGATRIDIDLVDTGTHLEFGVSDDGHGFDPDAESTGSGLLHMRDRVDALGGELAVMSSRASGSRVTGRLPSTARAPAPLGAGRART